MTDIVIKSILACNDIRREDSGKYIAIGIYGPDIVIPGEQTRVSLACLVQLTANKSGEYNIEFRCRENRNRELVASRGTFRTEFAAGNFVLDLNLGQINIRAGTEIDFCARATGGRWKSLLSLAVRGPAQQAELEAEIRAFREKPPAGPAASAGEPGL